MPSECSVSSLEEKLQHAQAQLAEGYFENAIEAFSEYLLVQSSEAKAYEGRGLAYFKIKNWSAALANFETAKQLNPDEPENWVGVAMSLAMQNEIYKAIDVFNELLAKYPEYARGHMQLGMLYYRLGVIKKGHEQMDLALASRPSLVERRTIEGYKKEQMLLDKKRFYRPDFEELRRKNKTMPGVAAQLFDYLRNKLKNFF